MHQLRPEALRLARAIRSYLTVEKVRGIQPARALSVPSSCHQKLFSRDKVVKQLCPVQLHGRHHDLRLDLLHQQGRR